MTIGLGTRLATLVCALVVSSIALSGVALAASRAAELGPQVPITEPKNGYVGKLAVSPSHGPAGTPVKVTGEGFPAEQEFELSGAPCKGRWKVTIAEYQGREYSPVGLPDRDGQERQVRPHRGELRGAGRFRLHA